MGVACSFMFVPMLAEIIESLQEEKEGMIEPKVLGDKASGISNTAYALGSIAAPILGGYLKMMTNFRVTCDIMALVSIVFGILYFLIAVLCSKR